MACSLVKYEADRRVAWSGTKLNGVFLGLAVRNESVSCFVLYGTIWRVVLCGTELNDICIWFCMKLNGVLLGYVEKNGVLLGFVRY